MRVVITGATGNVGSALVQALAADEQVESISGLARRRPRWDVPKVEWHELDVATADLREHFEAADAVVHLAWAIQPSRDLATLEATNIVGSENVFQAALEAGAGALLYASSVGAYSPGPQDRRVDEDWPREGIESSFYARHKAETERILDRLEQEEPKTRIVRLRPSLIFQGDAATEIRRYFLGPFVPNPLIRPGLVPLMPDVAGLRFQAVHSSDVAEAFRLAIHRDAKGAFNIAAEPALVVDDLARLLRSRTLRVPRGLLHHAANLSWRARLQPTPAGWVDMGLGIPLMDTTRARELLGWQERISAQDALAELVAGLREGRDAPTPPLAKSTSGPGRINELRSGVGARN